MSTHELKVMKQALEDLIAINRQILEVTKNIQKQEYRIMVLCEVPERNIKVPYDFYQN